MKNHTLMQTIARANRVFEDKTNGLIVDYIGIFRDLQKALAIYGTAQDAASEGDTPIRNKEELVNDLEASLKEAEEYCRRFDVEPEAILASQGGECVALIADAVDALLETQDSKKEFMSLAGRAIKLYKAILPDPRATEFQGQSYASCSARSQNSFAYPSGGHLAGHGGGQCAPRRLYSYGWLQDQ